KACAACFDHAPVLRNLTYLGVQFVTRNDAHLVSEYACNRLCFVRVVTKVHLLIGDFEMSAAGEVAFDVFVMHDLLDTINRGERSGKHTASAFAAVIGN